MLFPTHLLVAVGVGRLAGHQRVRRRLPSTPTLSAWWLVVGAALPDVVDKPLGTLGVVDTYHSVGHSLLLVPLAVALAVRYRRGLAVTVGWGSHLALDAFHVVANGRASDALFLAWPALTRSDPLAIPPGEFARFYAGSPSFYVELGLWLAAVVVVLRSQSAADRRDGKKGGRRDGREGDR
ncbi:metal-dependent hydrolase [Halorubrum lipolyticum]|uniref:Membrane-bound metal-dependent hydrolase n=1 Tax=Halorubrum lipolyticum DSM 21995 TaxID=1227482 RepID=M0P388_9EURY|nr:metal-dependent hydrolase [Halorubrum lipolyticum]EMA64298.1 membrane-bound metal-dependent hydrolase [Halorubrum lipolyticum DSM 21995]